MKGFCGGRNLLMFQKARKQTLDRKWDQGLHCKAHIYTYLFQLSSITQYFFFTTSQTLLSSGDQVFKHMIMHQTFDMQTQLLYLPP